MEEDLDELLEEVENKFINANSDGISRKVLKANILSPQSSFRCDSSDYEDILRDVDDNTSAKSVHSKSSRKEYSPLSSSKKRCFPLYLGGTDYSSGCSALGTPRCCNNLHCISCDFAIFYFDHFQWLPNTDYLFLRTNMPEFERVKNNLLPTEGCRAYACQCRHYSTSILQQIQKVPMLSWVCRGHTSQSARS